MERRDKVNYYLDLAEMVSQRSTCLRKHYGAVIVNNDEVISTGYVGAPRGRKNCSDIGRCIREELHVPRGERYELCRSVHALSLIHISNRFRKLMKEQSDSSSRSARLSSTSCFAFLYSLYASTIGARSDCSFISLRKRFVSLATSGLPSSSISSS